MFGSTNSAEDSLIFWDSISMYIFAGMWLLFNVYCVLYFVHKSRSEVSEFARQSILEQESSDRP